MAAGVSKQVSNNLKTTFSRVVASGNNKLLWSFASIYPWYTCTVLTCWSNLQ